MTIAIFSEINQDGFIAERRKERDKNLKSSQ